MLGDHRAVQVEVDRVGRRIADPVDDHRGDALEGVLGDVRRRFSRRPGRRDKLVAGALHLLDEARDGQVSGDHGLEHFAAALQAGPALGALEIRVRRLGRGEGVGFVLETAYGDAHQ